MPRGSRELLHRAPKADRTSPKVAWLFGDVRLAAKPAPGTFWPQNTCPKREIYLFQNSTMQKCFYITAAAVCLFAAPLAWAQPVQQDRQGSTSTINLTMEQKHIIKETVKELKIEGVAANLEVAIGEAVPKTIQLHPMPAQLSEKISHIKNHLFFLKGAQIVIVDPRENKAVDIID